MGVHADIAGQGKANPTSLILSAAILLEWLAEKRGREDLAQAARAVSAAIDQALAQPDGRTADLGGALATDAFAQRIADAVSI